MDSIYHLSVLKAVTLLMAMAELLVLIWLGPLDLLDNSALDNCLTPQYKI